ncbi:MAG: AraC family transcriptional regulator [Paludibacteraceae bacterium]|nr:AraC family transcriptional regulator [Paludibacteraceae bacterium]
MFFQIIEPAEALRPYVYRYVFVRAEGSTDTMKPPVDDPRFVNGKHVQPLLPNYGSLIFVRNAVMEIAGKQTCELVLLGANQTTLGLTTVSGWFEGMMIDFQPGGMHALLGIDLQQLAGHILSASEYADEGLIHCDRIFKHTPKAEQIAPLLDAFFLGRLPKKEDLNYKRISNVVTACDNAEGAITAAQMAGVACLGERQFLRIFRQYVGIPPKQFIRLRRFHRTIQDMQHQARQYQPIDLLATVLRHGYYDLSHAALEFHQMGCVSPGQFRMLGIPLTDDFSVFFA